MWACVCLRLCVVNAGDQTHATSHVLVNAVPLSHVVRPWQFYFSSSVGPYHDREEEILNWASSTLQ